MNVPGRKHWGLVAFFAVIATIVPVLAHGSEGEGVAWAWTTFFGLVAIMAAVCPDVFHAGR
jgi:hypothetical protein